MNFRFFAYCIVSAQLCFVAPIAFAHGDELSGSAQHGGQYTEVEGHHGVEMVFTKDALVFYLTENRKPMELAGASFKAVVQTNAGTEILPLVVENDSLRTRLENVVPNGTKIVLTGKDKNGHTLQARFVKE
ncbi:MAG: hypothetical protein ACR2RE_11810 [Geminicoccaceae bacterium]